MGQRYPRIGRATEGGGNAGNDLELDAVPAQCFDLFAAPAEYEGIPALEPNDAESLLRVGEHERVDVRLPGAREGATLADVDAPGVATAQFQHRWRNEVVMVDDVRPLQRAQGFQGEKVGIPGTGAHQRHKAFGRVSSDEPREFRIRCGLVAFADECGDIAVERLVP